VPRAVVTGAASGIGRALALRLRREGYDVLAVDRQVASLEEIEAEGVQILVADLTTPADRDRVVAEGSGASALANVAGVTRLKPILEVGIEDVREMFAANVEHVWDLTSRIGRTMPTGGAIVNVSSSAAKHPVFTDAAAYAASKAAILSLTRSFAYAFAPGVRVNAVCPGAINTPMRTGVLAHQADDAGVDTRALGRRRIKRVPLQRVASPEECASLMWYLLSDESSYMTGQAVNFTGGMITW
jgi:NAD(P)-dependent dehydrogenase (short-subunit alcohol dehydrogenase family)